MGPLINQVAKIQKNRIEITFTGIFIFPIKKKLTKNFSVLLQSNLNMESNTNVQHSALSVQKGIEQPSQVNPYWQQKPVKKRHPLTTEDYIKGILSGNRVLLSQAITLIESAHLEHQKIAQEIIQQLLPYSGNSFRIGITGVPGAGKSTFIESFGNALIAQKHKVAVLAVDPSSERSKGSILGDKTRMETLSVNPHAFIRPSPSGATLGGVTRKTRETIILCEAAGFDRILIETVGVGQSETAVHGMVDFFLLLMISGAGDELQGIKRGIMEMADTIVINKADGDNIMRANLAKTQYQSTLKMFPPTLSGWIPLVECCSALEHHNIEQIVQIIQKYFDLTLQNGYFQRHRLEQQQLTLTSLIQDRLTASFYHHQGIKPLFEQLSEDLKHQKISPYQAVEQLMQYYQNH